MAVTSIAEGQHPGEFIVSEAPGEQSRGLITLANTGGTAITPAGTILGQVASGAATATAAGGNTGNGTMSAVTTAAGVIVGTYHLICIKAATNAGVFTVEDPNGVTVGEATVGVAFSGGGLGFTVSDGSTDFVVGDQFTIAVAAGSLKYKAVNLSGTDGTQNASVILYDNVDATGGDVTAAAIVRLAEVNANEIIYPSGATTNQKNAINAQLAANNIIVRAAV